MAMSTVEAPLWHWWHQEPARTSARVHLEDRRQCRSMTECFERALQNMASWVGSHPEWDPTAPKADPPHVHLDEFCKEWHILDEYHFERVLQALACPLQSRYTAVVCDIGIEDTDIPQQPETITKVLALSAALGVPPAIYLPRERDRHVPSGFPHEQRRRVRGLRSACYEVWMCCHTWIFDGTEFVDSEVQFLQSA